MIEEPNPTAGFSAATNVRPIAEAFRVHRHALWGVVRGNEVIYAGEFPRRVARALADMENGDNPPDTWEEAKRRLAEKGKRYAV